MARQPDRLMADAFFQVAIGGDDIGLVIDQFAAEARLEMAFGHRHADGVAEALAQRAGGGLDAGGVAIFGMAGGAAADAAEVLQLIQRHLGIAGEMQQGIKHHRAMPGRKHEAVAVGPVRRGGMELEEARKENGGDIGHAQRQAGMARFGLLYRVQRQEADGVGELADLVLVGRGLGHGKFPGVGWL